MAKNNAICTVCGKPYYKCLSCKDMAKSKPWQMYTDTAEHYQIHQILHGYNYGVYTKQEAKTKLLKLDLSELETFDETTKNVIKIILEDETSKTTDAKIGTDNVKESAMTDKNKEVDTKKKTTSEPKQQNNKK